MNVDVSNLRSRYQRLRTEYQVEKVERRLREVESAVRFGGPGDSEPVLQVEMDMARQRGRTERFPELMLLMVGYSPEPLLSSLAFHRPRTVVLLASQLKEDYVESLKRLWDHYHEWLEVPGFDEVYLARREVRDSPESLFQEVSRVVGSHRGDRSRILLEITGAKKSMVAGAFLAAGLLDLEVSYVDFDDYDPVRRRPAPETCRSVELRNPYTLFKLREQHKLVEAFDDRRYGEARQLADELCQMVGRSEVVELLGESSARQEHSRYAFLAQLSMAYSSWSEGFYREAAEALGALKVPVPPTLEVLGGLWPARLAERSEIVTALEEDRVFSDPAVPIAYLLDVLLWNRSSTLEARPRESYLRLYGAIESLYSFALDALVLRSSQIRIAIPDGLVEQLQHDQPSSATGPLDWRGILEDVAIQALRENSTATIKLLATSKVHSHLGGVRQDKRVQGLKGLRLPSPLPGFSASLQSALPFAPLLNKKLKLHRYSKLRHKATHWVAPVPEQTALDLRDLLVQTLEVLIPPIVEARIGSATPSLADLEIARLRRWQGRLLAAARGEAVPECEPPDYEQATEWIGDSASASKETEDHPPTTSGDAR